MFFLKVTLINASKLQIKIKKIKKKRKKKLGIFEKKKVFALCEHTRGYKVKG